MSTSSSFHIKRGSLIALTRVDQHGHPFRVVCKVDDVTEDKYVCTRGAVEYLGHKVDVNDYLPGPLTHEDRSEDWQLASPEDFDLFVEVFGEV